MSQINVDIVAPQTGADVTIDGNLIVTGTNTIRPYKVYVGLLSQSNPTSAPLVEVLENSLGTTITWTRSGVGNYVATAGSSVFTAFKTTAFMQNSATVGVAPGTQLIAGRQSGTEVSVLTLLNDATSTPADGRFGLTPIEIRVYS